MIGTTLGRYRIVAQLGKGGMGSVWEAEDSQLARHVALKLIAEHQLDSPGVRERFLREGKSASRLSHPGIVTVFDAGEIEGRAFIAYERVEGESLEQRVASSPLPVAEAIRLARDTAAALAHAHGKGVLHRDLSCNNVMIRSDGSPVIIDLGLARGGADSRHTTTGTLMGTVGYLAPEQWRGEEANERTDLWALGVVWYRALLGRLPFGTGAMEAVMYRVLNDDPPKPRSLRAEVPEEFERIILRLLEKDPRDRFASAEQLAAAVARIRTDESDTQVIGLPSERPAARLGRWWRRLGRRLAKPRLTGAALIALLTVALLNWFAFQRGWIPGVGHSYRTIAVLPFANGSRDTQESAYIGEGLGEELISRLQVMRGIRTLPWSTTERYGANGQPLPRIARELHCDLLLTGSFRSDGERVHVRAEMVDGRRGWQLWSTSLDESGTDLATIQNKLATQILNQLRSEGRKADVNRFIETAPGNPEAYEYYLRGAGYMQSSDPATKDLAEPFFLKAAELDSTLAEAHVGLGAVHVDRYFRGAEGLRTGLEAADSRFRTALRIRPGFLRAVRGLINLSYEQGRCEVALQQAKANSAGRPDDVESQMTRAWAYALSGLPEKSVPILDRIITLEPRNSEAVWLGTFSRCWAGRYAESLASGKAYVRAFGEEPEMYTWMAIAADGLQRDEEAAAYFERALELFSDEESNMYSAFLAVSFYTRIGKPDRAQAIARHWIPLLQGRLEIAPDNLRAQCTLLGLLGALGMTAEVQQTTDELLDRLRNQSAMGGQALMFAVSASANVGDLARVRKLLGETGSRDLASFQQLLLPDWSRHVLTRPENEAALEAMPEYRSFVAAVRARVAELGARY